MICDEGVGAAHPARGGQSERAYSILDPGLIT